MKKCKVEGCKTEINDQYDYCYEHYKTRPPGTIAPVQNLMPRSVWHDDPVVDALLKLNSNVGSIARILEQIRDRKTETPKKATIGDFDEG